MATAEASGPVGVQQTTYQVPQTNALNNHPCCKMAVWPVLLLSFACFLLTVGIISAAVLGSVSGIIALILGLIMLVCGIFWIRYVRKNMANMIPPVTYTTMTVNAPPANYTSSNVAIVQPPAPQPASGEAGMPVYPYSNQPAQQIGPSPQVGLSQQTGYPYGPGTVQQPQQGYPYGPGTAQQPQPGYPYGPGTVQQPQPGLQYPPDQKMGQYPPVQPAASYPEVPPSAPPNDIPDQPPPSYNELKKSDGDN